METKAVVVLLAAFWIPFCLGSSYPNGPAPYNPAPPQVYPPTSGYGSQGYGGRTYGQSGYSGVYTGPSSGAPVYNQGYGVSNPAYVHQAPNSGQTVGDQRYFNQGYTGSTAYGANNQPVYFVNERQQQCKTAKMSDPAKQGDEKYPTDNIVLELDTHLVQQPGLGYIYIMDAIYESGSKEMYNNPGGKCIPDEINYTSGSQTILTVHECTIPLNEMQVKSLSEKLNKELEMTLDYMGAQKQLTCKIISNAGLDKRNIWTHVTPIYNPYSQDRVSFYPRFIAHGYYLCKDPKGDKAQDTVYLAVTTTGYLNTDGSLIFGMNSGYYATGFGSTDVLKKLKDYLHN